MSNPYMTDREFHLPRTVLNPQRLTMELDLTLPAFEPLAAALIVDDDEDILYLLRHLLLRDGFIVHSAKSGRDAQQFIADSEPTDVVVLDLMLPYVDGFELITQIREDRYWADTPVIVLSGKMTEQDAVRSSAEAGRDDAFRKSEQASGGSYSAIEKDDSA